MPVRAAGVLMSLRAVGCGLGGLVLVAVPNACPSLPADAASTNRPVRPGPGRHRRRRGQTPAPASRMTHRARWLEIRLHARRSGQLEPGNAARRPSAASAWTGLPGLEPHCRHPPFAASPGTQAPATGSRPAMGAARSSSRKAVASRLYVSMVGLLRPRSILLISD
jgi:hypothetical protein